MQRNNKKRGMTMAELCVAMAVISIVATMVVSFSVLISERSKSATSKQKTITDINLIESIVEDWINANKDAGINFSDSTSYWDPNNNKGTYMIVSSLVEIHFELEDTGLKNLNMNTQKIVLCDNIKGIEFWREGDTLYYCKITYKVFDTGEEDYYYTFCVNTALPD